MKTLFIHREESTDEGTFGTAMLSEGPSWHSLELPDRDNLPDRSRIPAGRYLATTIHSAKFGMDVYRLIDVPGRQNIEIHPANWAGDTTMGYHSDLEGCISIGFDVGVLQTPEGHEQRAIKGSRGAFQELMEATAGADITVDIA